jgi:hypothetical protein
MPMGIISAAIPRCRRRKRGDKEPLILWFSIQLAFLATPALHVPVKCF